MKRLNLSMYNNVERFDMFKNVQVKQKKTRSITDALTVPISSYSSRDCDV